MFTYTSTTPIDLDLTNELCLAADILFTSDGTVPVTELLDSLCEQTPYADHLVDTAAALTARMFARVGANTETQTRGEVADILVAAAFTRAWEADDDEVALAQSIVKAIVADEPVTLNAPATRVLVKVAVTLSSVLATGYKSANPGDPMREVAIER